MSSFAFARERSASFCRRDVRFPFPSFPRKLESIVNTVRVDPRLLGDDEGWMAAEAGMRALQLPLHPRAFFGRHWHDKRLPALER